MSLIVASLIENGSAMTVAVLDPDDNIAKRIINIVGRRMPHKFKDKLIGMSNLSKSVWVALSSSSSSSFFFFFLVGGFTCVFSPLSIYL